MARALPSPDPRIATPRPETGHRLVSWVVQTYMATAAGHLGAMSALLARGEVMFSPGMLVRAVIECTARVFWVLGKPGDSPDQLLARAYLEEMRSAEEAKKAAGRMGDGSEIHQDHVQAWTQMRAEIMSRFPGSTKEAIGKGSLAGESFPSPQAAVSQMYDLLANNNASSIDGDVAKGMYDYLSNVTHPTLYPSRQMTEWLPHPNHPGELFAQLTLDVSDVEREVSAAVLAFYQTMSFVTSFYGWNRSVFDRFRAEVERSLPNAFM